MRWLLFLSRLAFICGICFLVTLVFAMMKREIDHTVTATVVVIGYGMGMVIVPVTVICYTAVILSRRKLSAIVPLWLICVNVIFLFVLLYYIFYWSDPYYHQ